MPTLTTSGNKRITEPDTALATVQPAELSSYVPTSPVERTMLMIERAIGNGASLEQVQQLLDMQKQVVAEQERREARDAEKAYIAAMTAFKDVAPPLVKDKFNKQYDSWYTSLGNMVKVLTPLLAAQGLSASWTVDQANGIKVSCIMRHKLGHSERETLIVPPDKSGAKNPIQEIKSAITYAKSTTYENICGTASTEANVDDDGNGAGKGKKPTMDEGDVVAALESIADAPTLAELHTIYSGNYRAAQKIGDKSAMKSFIDAKDRRKAELQEQAA